MAAGDEEGLAGAREALDALISLGATSDVAWRAVWLADRMTASPDGHAEARRLLEVAVESHRSLDDHEGLVIALRALARLMMGAERVAEDERIDRSLTLLTEAAERAEKLWQAQPTIEWRLAAGQASGVHAELAWLRAARGGDDLIRHLCLAKNREFVEHTRPMRGADGRAVQHLASDARRAEMGRWTAQRDALPTKSVFAEQAAASATIQAARFEQALLIGTSDVSEEAHRCLASFFRAQPGAVVWDFTTSEWGTVVTRTSAGGTAICRAPLTQDELREAVQRVRAKHSSWSRAPQLERPHAWAEWESETERLLDVLRARLFDPALATFGDLDSSDDLVFVAGSLAGLPLHAVRVGDTGRVVDRVRSVAYATNLARLPTQSLSWKPPSSMFFVLADPQVEGRARLEKSREEVARLGEHMARLGTNVTIVASYDGKIGEEVFHGLDVSSCSVEPTAPSAAVLQRLAAAHEAFCFSGHGFAHGLLLATAEGKPEQFTREDLLAMPGLEGRPLFHFSACSTAQEFGSFDSFHFASCALRVGARAVVAGLWELRDEEAAMFSEAFYQEATKGSHLPRACTDAAKLVRTVVGDEHVLTWAPFVILLGP